MIRSSAQWETSDRGCWWQMMESRRWAADASSRKGSEMVSEQGGVTREGWYEDPGSPSDMIRYWNRSSWTHHTRPKPETNSQTTSDIDFGTARVAKHLTNASRNLQPCPDCGTGLSPFAATCVKCGRPMTHYPAATSAAQWAPQPIPDDKSGRYALEAAMWIIVFIIGLAITVVFPLALIVVLVAAVGFVGALIRSISARSRINKERADCNIFGP